MDSIKKEAMGLVRKKGGLLEAQLQRNISVDVGFKSSSIERKSKMVGFDDVRLQLLDRRDSSRRIIPIVGMGGIGKTTLALNVFADKLTKEHFDVCVWATISQDYDIERTLREVLYSSNSLCMSFLNEFHSWILFSKSVFGSEGSVPHLEPQLREIGEKIEGKCKGLPLSIAVIGGLLAKSERTQGYWEYIEENLSSIVNLENEEHCLRVLKLSYNHLPVYLKPCFLYMGVFDEDSRIKVSTIIHLWVSEGFLKPKKGKKNTEAVARAYIQELVDRNLVLGHDDKVVSWELTDHDLGSVGMTKLYKMHDLVRDLSMREAQKQRFCYVHSKSHNPPPQETSSHYRHIVIPCKNLVSDDLECWPNSRAYVCHNEYVRRFPNFRLLRTLHVTSPGVYITRQKYSQEDVFGFLVNLQFLWKKTGGFILQLVGFGVCTHYLFSVIGNLKEQLSFGRCINSSMLKSDAEDCLSNLLLLFKTMIMILLSWRIRSAHWNEGFPFE